MIFSALQIFRNYILLQHSMGVQCSCSTSTATKNQQIEHTPQQACKKQDRTTKDISAKCLPQQPEVQPQAQVPQKQSIKKIEEKCGNAPEIEVAEPGQPQPVTQKTVPLQAFPERKKNKKVVQVMVPQNDGKQQSVDKVNFVQKKELTKAETQLITKTLKNHFILSQLSAEEIQYVVSKMKFCTIQKGKFIFQQGNPSYSYYVILEGKCSVHISGEFKRNLEPGAAFGDLGIIYNAPRSASIRAEQDCTFAELNSKTFRRIINDLNSIYEQSHKKILENLQFYNNLTEPQKNSLAANCIVQIYQAGQVIFNKGDDANAFYLIREGIVTILQKNIDLKAGENVGVNAILSNTKGVRSNSLIAKTNCKLLSLTRDLIIKNLGDNISNILRKNLVLKIIKQSDIWEMYGEEEWHRILQRITSKQFKKNQLIFQKDMKIQPLNMLILLKADARSVVNPKAKFYIANSVIEQNKVFKKQQVLFDENFEVCGDSELVTLKLPSQKGARTEKNIKQQKVKLNLKDFIVLRNLRSGNFGKVYACYNKATKQKYAIKVMNKQTLMLSNVLSYIEKETELLASIPEHPFLIRYYETFTHQNLILLTMALIEGQDLFDSLNSKLPLKENDAMFYIAQLILVLEHLHDNKVVYRDLKPENVMLAMSGYLTLVDLGTAKKLTLENRFKTSTIIGTPHYMAPQILLGKGYTFTADWWSLGIMLYQMVTGKLPYGQNLEDPFAVYQQIIKNELQIPQSLSYSCQQILTKLLTKSMPRRLRNGLSQLKQMQFFKDIDWSKLVKKQYEGKIFPAKASLISNQEVDRVVSKKKSSNLMSTFMKGIQDKMMS